MVRVLVSACLLGEKVRYDGRDALADSPILARWRAEGRLIPLCPELVGGLPVPRPPAEIQDGDGYRVLAGDARILTDGGDDVTDAFLAGAERALAAARDNNCQVAILTERSPSCGVHQVYDGRFNSTRKAGLGVTTAQLSRAGIAVFNQYELEDAARYLKALEQPAY